MSNVGDAIRAHHRELLDTLTEQATLLADNRPEADPAAFLAFLKEDLLPHARREERHLYLLLDALIKKYDRPTNPMRIDHRALEEYVRRIDVVSQGLTVAGGIIRGGTGQKWRDRMVRSPRCSGTKTDARLRRILSLHFTTKVKDRDKDLDYPRNSGRGSRREGSRSGEAFPTLRR